MNELLFIIIISGVVALVLIPISIRIATSYNIVDHPDSVRKLHSESTPYLGGLIIFGGLLTGMFLISTVSSTPIPIGVFGGLTLLFLVGLWDDMRDLPAILKLCIQIISILLIAPVPSSFTLISISIFITVIGVGILSINALNLIDGMDGLSAGQVLIILPPLFIYELLAGRYQLIPYMAIFAVSVAIFSYANINPAKIFLGDAGSLLEGGFLFWIVSHLSQNGTDGTVSVIPFLIILFSLPIVDVFSVIIQRIVNHQGIMTADRRHIHHQLEGCGFSRYITVQILNGFLSLYSLVWIIILYTKSYDFIILFPVGWLHFYLSIGALKSHKENV